MMIVEEKYDFELSSEVREKIENAGNRLVLIDENELADLQYISVSNKGYRLFKAVMDFMIALLAIVVLFVPMVLIALFVYLDDPGDIIFTQYRVGLHGKRFKLYKFRTMKMDTPKYLSTMELEDPNRYITRAGLILRKLSLDELPQLLNVLKGEMSIVGPRPLISDEYEIHTMRILTDRRMGQTLIKIPLGFDCECKGTAFFITTK